MIAVHHRVPGDRMALGIVRVEGLQLGPAPAALERALDECVERRRQPLDAAEERCRTAGRDMLRNGRYKPTGRGKPASEYLLRAAGDAAFPRINAAVDAINLVSLQHLVPISLWDLERAGTSRFEFRLGGPAEQYVFNAAGQVLSLEDLVCGCALTDERSQPIVTPIKDSMATKIQQDSIHAAACIYFPLTTADRPALQTMTDELLRWLCTCGPDVRGAGALALPGEQVGV